MIMSAFWCSIAWSFSPYIPADAITVPESARFLNLQHNNKHNSLAVYQDTTHIKELMSMPPRISNWHDKNILIKICLYWDLEESCQIGAHSTNLIFYLFISPLFNQVGKLRTSSHLQLRPGLI
jgi:hypothetical protein